MFDVNKELTELENNYHDYCNQFNINFPDGKSDKVSESINKLIQYFKLNSSITNQELINKLNKQIVNLEDEIKCLHEDASEDSL